MTRRRALALVALGLLPLMGRPPAVAAQSSLQPAPARLLVAPIASLDSLASKYTASALRSWLNATLSFREFYVLPGRSVDDALTSGWGTARPFEPRDVMTLSTLLRADLVVNGRAERTADSTHLFVILEFDRNAAMIQPLGRHAGRDPASAARSAGLATREALRQHAGYRACRAALAAQQYKQAEDAARDAITAYPDAVPARVCLAKSLTARNAPADSISAVRRAILTRDSTNTFAVGAGR